MFKFDYQYLAPHTADNTGHGGAGSVSPRVTVVLPVYNEVDNLNEINEELMTHLPAIGGGFEILYIDDGSSDGSTELLRQLAASYNEVRAIIFRRNFGQTAAMAAGLEYSRGDIVVTLDADRQNDPADIPAMIQKLDEGYDLVCGWRHQRQDGFLLRLLPSMIANKLISATTDVKLHDYGCTLKAFKSDVAKNIQLYGEMHRFIPAIASWMGVKIAEMKVNHRPRVAGQSKYGISRTFRVVLDLITVKFMLSYSSRPIQLFGAIGLVSGLLGFVLCLMMVIQRMFFDVPMADRPLLLLAIMLIFLGLQFVTLGLLAEIQTRTYHEAQKKSIYVVREIV